MVSLTRAIQADILFATAFGVPFLYEVYPVLHAPFFYAVTLGWILFVLDSALTFFRPRLSYYLGMVLAIAAFSATVSQPAHFQLMRSGDLAATVTILVGSASEVALIVLVAVYIVAGRRKDRWAVSSSPQS